VVPSRAALPPEARPDARPENDAPDPRAVRSKAAVLQSTVELMVERGVHAVSVDAIAERSGVAKTTIYRHWPTREAVIVAAWSSIIPGDDESHLGTVHEQVRALALAFAKRIGNRPMSVLLPDLLAAAERDPAMRDLYENVLRARRRSLRDAIVAGVSAGSLPAGTDADLVVSLILGPIAYEQLVLRHPVDEGFVDRVVSTVLDATQHDLVGDRTTRTSRPRRRPSSSKST
jgi:AcrR family transcriptional regulator